MRPLVVVLGASGFLGHAVVRRLAGAEVRLRLVGRRPVAVPPGARAQVEARRVDLTAGTAVADAVRGADGVLHLVLHNARSGTWRVAEKDAAAERVNCGLLRDVVGAVRAERPRRPPAVVLAGSISQVGRGARGPVDGTEQDEPVSGYDVHKLAAERVLFDATADGVVRGTSLRLTTLYGDGRGPAHLERGVVAAMLRRARAGEPLTMWNDGAVLRDLLCVDDAAAAFVRAVAAVDPLAGRPWPVGTGRATALKDLFALIAGATARVTGEPPVPVVRVDPQGDAVASDDIDFVAAPAAFRAASGWAAREQLEPALERAAAALAAG